MSTQRFSVLLAAVMFTACSDGVTGPNDGDPGGTIGISPNPVVVSVGEMIPLKATGLGTTLVVLWSSDDPSVASIATGGILRGIKAGVTTVHAQAGSASASTRVTVR